MTYEEAMKELKKAQSATWAMDDLGVHDSLIRIGVFIEWMKRDLDYANKERAQLMEQLVEASE